MSVQLLGGVRYINLEDSFQMNYGSNSFFGVTTVEDRFQTRNQFFGGQLGARADYAWKMLTIGLTGKVALGNNHEVSTISGASTQTGLPPFNGGQYTQPTNIGTLTHDHFSCVPQVGLKVSVNLTSWVSVFAGYDFMYWTGVARAGDQLDRSVNPSQSPIFGAGRRPRRPRPPGRQLHQQLRLLGQRRFLRRRVPVLIQRW